MFKIVATHSFLKDYSNFFDNSELIKFEKFKLRLSNNPYLGDPIRVPYVREFKTSKGKRAYFLVYDSKKIVLFVGYSNKKNQKKVIGDIFRNLSDYLNFEF